MATIVLGIDGATFELFEDWLDDLPTIGSIIDGGVSERLDSCTPPVTSPAWRCYATGKNPASIGVYWWRQLDRQTNEFVGADEIPLDSKCYWEYLSDDDATVVVMGVPLNAPPRAINGALVAGGPFANPDNYTYPSALGGTLESNFDFQLHPKLYPSVSEARDERFVRDFEAMIDQRFNVAQHLRREHDPDLLNLTLFYINTMQHKAWDAPEVKRLWELIDARLAELVDDDDDVIVHSDHGLHEVKRVFYINAWLEENGYLVRSEAPLSERLTSKAVDAGRRTTESIGIKSLVKSIVPESMLSGGRRLIDSTSYESRIDFEESTAVALPQGPIYVLSDETGVRDRLRDELLDVRDPETGNRVIRAVERAEDVYGTPVPEDAPDLLVRWYDGFEVKDVHSVDPEKTFGEPHGVLADNQQQGILLARGPNIADGDVEHPELFDLAPTLLHLHGSDVPDDMDGRVLTELFSEDSGAADRAVSYRAGESMGGTAQENATQDVDNRLRDLGYLE